MRRYCESVSPKSEELWYCIKHVGSGQQAKRTDMIKNFIKVVSNPALFSPTVYLVPEIIKYDEEHTIIHVHIPPSAEVHSYKKVIYDRVDAADVKVTATGAIWSKWSD